MRCRLGAALGCTLLVVSLGGCETAERLNRYYVNNNPIETPVDWWHQLQGGTIADERPPPPGVDDPYPNLAIIPAKPTPPAAATRKELTARLAAERDRTLRAAAQDPIVPIPGSAAAAPASATAAGAGAGGATAPGVRPAPGGPPPAKPANAPAPAEPAAPMARIAAADAPPPAPATAAAPPAPPAPAAIQATAAPKPPPREPDPAAPPVSGPVPALPSAPPPAPVLSGIPASTFAPATPRPRPQVDAAFVGSSAVLRPESDAALRALAGRRAGGTIALLGGGDAISALPDAQAAALPLAWRRAQAMAGVLTGAGVPANALRVDAAALARGGIARLID